MIRRCITIVFTFLLCFGAMAQKNNIPLWKIKNLPNYRKTKEKEVYPKRNILSIQKVQTPSIQPLIPSRQSANGKAVLICPGGGYGSLSYDWEGTDVAKWLNSQGIAAFVLKYRLPQSASVIISYKAPLQDAQRAMRWIRYNAKKYNVDVNKVGVIGFSAGGHLASTLGTHYDMPIYDKKDDIDNLSARPDFMMLLYPVISMKKGITHYGSRLHLLGKNPNEKLINEFSNELHVTKDTPPTFIVQASNDPVVPVENSILMYQALVKNKISASMHFFPTGGHGFGLGLNRAGAPHWEPLAKECLDALNK